MSDIRLKTEHEMKLHLRIAELEAALKEADEMLEARTARLTARIAELEAELAHARLAFGKLIVRHTKLDPDDTWDAMMDEIRARPTP
jgi:hypothetical protein